MPASSAELLSRLATHVRELRERRGWTQAQLAAELRLPVEDVIDIERKDFGDASIVAARDGSIDFAPHVRRRWLTRMGIAIEILSREGTGWNAACLDWIRATLQGDDRGKLRELLRSEDELDWWSGIRFAALTGDAEAIPFVRDLARAPGWFVSAHTRERANWALSELGAQVGPRVGALTLADTAGKGALELAESGGAVSLPDGGSAESSERRGRLAGIAESVRADEEPRRALSVYEAGSVVLRAILEVAMIVMFSCMVGWIVHLVLATGLPSWLERYLTLAFTLGLMVVSAAVYLRETRRNVFSLTRKRWARNRAQRLRGS